MSVFHSEKNKGAANSLPSSTQPSTGITLFFLVHWRWLGWGDGRRAVYGSNPCDWTRWRLVSSPRAWYSACVVHSFHLATLVFKQGIFMYAHQWLPFSTLSLFYSRWLVFYLFFFFLIVFEMHESLVRPMFSSRFIHLIVLIIEHMYLSSNTMYFILQIHFILGLLIIEHNVFWFCKYILL